ncbi:complex I subunit 5 family protein [Helicovermis profundi]
MWKYLIKNGVITILLGGWNKSIGIELRIDNLSMLFITMTVLIWWLVLIYSWEQKKKDYKFLFFLLFLEGSFIALLQSNDLFTLFVLIEIVTILSSILIIYKKDGKSLKSGLFYLLFNSFSMMIYLLGIILIYIKVGTLNMSQIREYILANLSSNQSVYINVSFACFIVVMSVKSAVFPVYEWLPRAHTASQTSVSTLLSGLLVKTGIYGMIRFLYVFNNNNIYEFLFLLGAFTAITGAIFAISQKDIKAMLAFSTISQIGLIVISLSTNSDIGFIGAYLHIFNHFLFKSLLFLGVGILINEYGLRRINQIKGIGRSHPLLSICMIIGILSMTGFPLQIGFLSKSMIKYSFTSNVKLLVFQFSSFLTIIAFIKFSSIFFGKPEVIKTLKKNQIFSITILTLICILAFFIELKFIPSFIRINGSDISSSMVYIIKKINLNIYSKMLIKNIIDYFIMVILGFYIYKYFIKTERRVFYKIRNYKVNYQNAILLLMLFLSVTIKIVN